MPHSPAQPRISKIIFHDKRFMHNATVIRSAAHAAIAANAIFLNRLPAGVLAYFLTASSRSFLVSKYCFIERMYSVSAVKPCAWFCKRRQKNKALNIQGFCGERGIRTPGGVTLNGFQDRRNRPLCHLSSIFLCLLKTSCFRFCVAKVGIFFLIRKTF